MLNQMCNTVSDLVGKYLEAFSDFGFIVLGGIITALVLVVFLIACAAANSSRARQLKLRLQHVTAYIDRQDEISEENVADLNRELRVLPEDVRLGWGNFLDRQVGYPSEYMSEPEVLKERSYHVKSRRGRVFFHVVAWIVILLGVGVTATVAKYGFLGFNPLFEKSKTIIDLLVYVLSAIYIPLLGYAVLSAGLNGIYKKQAKQAMLAYRAFKDALDNKVSIFRPEETEVNVFYQEHKDEINSAIEEIVANKIGHTEIMEIVTVPRIAEDEVIFQDMFEPSVAMENDVVAESAPDVEEVVEPVVEVAAEKTESANPQSSQLEVLLGLVRNALSDKNATEEDLEDLQHYIMQAKIAGFKDTKDQEVLAECIKQINEYMIVVQGKASPLTDLLFVVDNAVNDPSCNNDDLKELRSLMVAAKSAERFQPKKEQKILSDCIGMIDRMFKK